MEPLCFRGRLYQSLKTITFQKGISISEIAKLSYIHYWLKYAIITNQKVDIVSLISAKFHKEVGRLLSGLHRRDAPLFWFSALCCCSVVQSCLTLCEPMDCSTPGLPVLHCLPEFAQIHVHWVCAAIQLSHPLLPPPPPVLSLSQNLIHTENSASAAVASPGKEN